MSTMKEVALHADVSVATVSRVINRSGYVSPDLVERVQEAMRALNYQPSALARSLRRRESLTVGVLIPQLDHPFFGALAFAIEKSLFANDYRTLICSSEEDRSKENAYIDILLGQRVDGVIVAPTGQSSEALRKLREARVPVVLVDRNLNVPQVDKVLSSNYQGGYDGMLHLLEQGHRNIGVIGAPAYSEAMVLRMKGIHQALADFNVKLRPKLIETESLQQFQIGFDTAMQLLQQPDPPTAIFALTDVMAIGVMHAASQLGLKLPENLSVMGFDGIPLAAYSIPELTTVAQPIYEMGETATRLLLKRIHYDDLPYETVMLENKLIVRKSVAQIA
jgi:LacI family transcriptional regulator